MKAKSVLIALFVVIAVVSAVLVSCNFNIDQSSRETTVNFVPSTSKSLNQSGSAQSIAGQDASMYRWEYAVIKDNVVDTKDENVEWKEFQTPIKDGSGNITSYEVTKTGLGAIRGLERNEAYGFALRGYSTGTDGELMWEGATGRTYKLQSKVVQITVDVIPVGRGMLYFDIYAPVADFNTSLTDIEHPDKFEITYKNMNKEDSGSLTCKTVLTSDSDEWSYNTIGKEPVLISSGTYLFTVQQTTYDDVIKQYVEVKGRKQVLIVDIYSGMDTVISGSLDSTSLVIFDYDGGAAGKRYGIEAEFINTGNIDDVKNLPVKVLNADGDEKYVRRYDRIFVKDNAYLIIDFSSASDEYSIYVNGEEVFFREPEKMVTDDTLKDSIGNYRKFYLKDYSKADSEAYKGSFLNGWDEENKTIIAWGKQKLDYLVTIVSGNRSMTFTIMGRNDLIDTSVATGIFSEAELTTLTDITLKHIVEAFNPGDIDVNATMKAADALKIMNDILTEDGQLKSADSSKNFITLTLYVKELEVTTSNAKYEIWMEAQVNIQGGYESLAKNIEEVNDYVNVTMKIQPYLKDMLMNHNSSPMIKLTKISLADPLDDTDGVGFFSYNPEYIDGYDELSEEEKKEIDKMRYEQKKYLSDGILDIQTRTFSPFASTYKTAKEYHVDYNVMVNGKWETKFSEKVIEDFVIPFYEITNEYGNYAKWKKGPNEEDTAWDFERDVAKSDMTLYASWTNPKVTFWNGDKKLAVISYGYHSLMKETPKVSVTGDDQFIGWCTKKDGSIPVWDTENEYIKEDIDVYAQIVPTYRMNMFDPDAYGIVPPYAVSIVPEEQYEAWGTKANGTSDTIYECTWLPEGVKMELVDDPNNNKWGYKLLKYTYDRAHYLWYEYVLVPGTLDEVRVYKNYDPTKTEENNANKSLVATLKLGDGSYYVTDSETVSIIPHSTVSVKIENNNGTSSTVSTKLFEKVEVETPTRYLCDFLGWYKDAALTKKWTTSTDIVTAETTLYASWKLPYTFSIEKTVKNYKNYKDPIKITLTPADLEDYTITWKSKDEDIATVDDDGVITGKGPGETTITATIDYKGLKDEETTKVTVEEGSPLSLKLQDWVVDRYYSNPSWSSVPAGTSPRWKDIVTLGENGNYVFTSDSNGYVVFKNKGADPSKSEGWNSFQVYTDSKMKNLIKVTDTTTASAGQTYYLKRAGIQIFYYPTDFNTKSKTFYIDYPAGTKFKDLIGKSFVRDGKTFTWGTWKDYGADRIEYHTYDDCVYLYSGTQNYLLTRAGDGLEVRESDEINYGYGFNLYPSMDITVKIDSPSWGDTLMFECTAYPDYTDRDNYFDPYDNPYRLGETETKLHMITYHTRVYGGSSGVAVVDCEARRYYVYSYLKQNPSYTAGSGYLSGPITVTFK